LDLEPIRLEGMEDFHFPAELCVARKETMLVKLKIDVCHIRVVSECVCNLKIENQLSQIWKELDLNLNSKNMVQNQSGTTCHRAEQRV